MALINCAECGNQVSTSAPACPGCNATPEVFNPESLRRKVIRIGVGLTLIVVAVLWAYNSLSEFKEMFS